jgi:hypothetical protein
MILLYREFSHAPIREPKAVRGAHYINWFAKANHILPDTPVTPDTPDTPDSKVRSTYSPHCSKSFTITLNSFRLFESYHSCIMKSIRKERFL